MLFELSVFRWNYPSQSLKVVPTTPVRTMEHVMVDGRETMNTVAVSLDGMVITVS